MFRKALKGTAVVLGILASLVILGGLALYVMTEERLNKSYPVQVPAVKVPTGPDAITRGLRLVRTRAFCQDCHGQNLAGQSFDDGLLIGRMTMPNLTRGKGGIGSTYTDTDWVRAIRHGVDREGKPLIDMPANFYYHLSDSDLGDLIAYMKSLPSVDNELPGTRLGIMGRIYLLLMPSLIPAEQIDHDRLPPPAPEPGVTVEYGEYLASACRFCHGDDLAGGSEPGEGLNLTPAGNLKNWTEDDFLHSIRTGITPEGKQLKKDLMPWDRISGLTDDELKAIWLYLQSLAPVVTASQ